MAVTYRIRREEQGKPPEPLAVASSLEDAMTSIRGLGRPGIYGIYEHIPTELEGITSPEERGGVVLTPAGHLWERRPGNVPRPHDHRREDGWSAYLMDQASRTWVYCRPDGTKAGEAGGAGPEQVDAILAKVDEGIGKVS